MGEIKVVFSSINLAMSSGALRSPEWLGAYATGAHCDGIEYMPMFDKLPGHTPRAVGRAVASGALDLNSLHATFREGGASADTNRLPGDPGSSPDLKSRLIRGPLGRLLLPEVCESSTVMANIQHSAGKHVPVVLYPQSSSRRDRRQVVAAEASRHLFQPTDHVGRLVGATSLATFDNTMRMTRGYNYVLDTYHVRRRYGRDGDGIVSDTSASVPFMAPYTTALHLSLNRSDIPGEPHIPTRDEGRDALSGKYSGALREMLDVVKEKGAVDYVVIEATSGGIGELSGHTSLNDIQKDYADIADGFRQYWAA